MDCMPSPMGEGLACTALPGGAAATEAEAWIDDRVATASGLPKLLPFGEVRGLEALTHEPILDTLHACRQ